MESEMGKNITHVIQQSAHVRSTHLFAVRLSFFFTVFGVVLAECVAEIFWPHLFVGRHRLFQRGTARGNGGPPLVRTESQETSQHW